MTAVVAAVILIAAVSSILCGHHHEPAPPCAARALRAVRRRPGGPSWAYGRIRARRYARQHTTESRPEIGAP